MKPQLTAAQCDRVLRSIHSDETKASRRKYGDPPARCIGVSLRDVGHEDEIEEMRAAARVRAYAETGRGCGARFLIGWAGNSPAHCGAELAELGGNVRILKCPACGGKD